MKEYDPALKFSNPRLLCAIYFGVLSVVGTVLIDAFLILLGIEEIVPLYQSVLLGMVVASATGALCGKVLIYSTKPFISKVFAIGFFMVLGSLPVFTFGLVWCMYENGTQLFALNNIPQLVYAYLLVLGYSYFLYGLLLATACGFASIYLRGWLVYDILHTDKRRSVRLPRYVAAHSRAKHHKPVSHHK